tara:strand:- start:247 stop:567 length:321 start_codon:yes stop_codon:yes gene_type:complete
MAYFALMTREQFGRSRAKLRNQIKFTEDNEEFLCRLNADQDIEDCTKLSQSEMEEHVATSPKWTPQPEVDLSAMSKAELITLAQERGVKLPEKRTKASIIAALGEN